MVSGELELAVADVGDAFERALEVAREIAPNGVELHTDSIEALIGRGVPRARARSEQRGTTGREEGAAILHGGKVRPKGEGARGAEDKALEALEALKALEGTANR